MKVVFCGTPEFAVPTVSAIVSEGHEVALVLTQPDRPAGRKMTPQVSAVKHFALQHGLTVQQPERIKNNAELQVTLQAIQPDVIVVVAYGRIIPQWMLDLPRLGNINLHGSLLPKYRGAAPIQWAIAKGESTTGVTTMRLDAGLDTGDILLQASLPIPETATSADMYPVLAQRGAALMLETLRGLEASSLRPQEQDHSQATLAPILTREDGQINLTRTAKQAYDRWRGFSPWPGCYGEFRGRRFILHRIRPSAFELPEQIKPGELFLHNEHLVLVVAQNSALVLDEIQVEGKMRMRGTAFWRDFQVKSGERVG